MPTQKKTKSAPKRQAAHRESKPPLPKKHTFVWNWRMVILGILLNAATFVLVLISISILNDYQKCTQEAIPAVIVPDRESNSASTNTNVNSWRMTDTSESALPNTEADTSGALPVIE